MAIATRTAAVGSAPNSAAPMRMNRKDAPHSAPSSTRSTSQRLLAGRAGVVGSDRLARCVRGRAFAFAHKAPSSSSSALLRSRPPA